MTLETLKDVAAKHNIAFPNTIDEQAYLLLLQSADVVMQRVQESADYVHPDLLPQPVVGDNRKYWKLSPNDNPLNAWSHRCELVARNPANSLLKGRTIAIKDNISVGGLPTTIGTFPRLVAKNGEYPISPIDATVVSRILSAGGTIKGTSTCENYSASPLSFTSANGPVHNPWLHGYTTGGSSSGSGALVAANAIGKQKPLDNPYGETVEMALGGDQGGSIRIPASYNGIYGLKPTHGLIPYTGAASLSPMIDHLGPMASSLRDIALLLQVLAGYDGLDARMTPESPLRHQVKDYPVILDNFLNRKLDNGAKLGSALKVGVIQESFLVPGLSDEVRDRVRQSAETFFAAAGASVVEISIPLHTEAPLIWTAATRTSMVDWGCQGRALGYLTHSPPHISMRWPPDQEMYELLTATNPAVINIMFGGAFLKEEYGAQVESKAHRKIFELRAAYDEALKDVDVLVTPCAPTVAMRHPKMNHDAETESTLSTVMEKMRLSIGSTSNTAPFNATGHPAMSVPCGFGSAEGTGEQLPIGMQIIAKRWDEEMLLKAAAIFEEGRRWSLN